MRFPHFGSEVAGLQVADGKKQVRQYMTCNLLCVMVHWHINLQLRFGEHFVSPPPLFWFPNSLDTAEAFYMSVLSF